MADRPRDLRTFLAELKRRKVYQVTAVYLVAAIAALEIVDVVVPSTSLPSWSDELLLALAIIGLPLAIVLAWAFDVTPGGIEWTPSGGVVSVEEGASEGGPAAAVPHGDPDGDARPPLDERAVAVLPFENLSGADAADPFAAGRHDDVLTELSRVPGLTVISRTSVKRYAGRALTLPEIGRELGAGTVVEGGVQAAAGRVRLNVQMIDARTDQHRWAERYDRVLSTETMLEIQSELAERIASTLQTTLVASAVESEKGPATNDLEAYRLHARGRQLFLEYTAEGMHGAEAVRADPRFRAVLEALDRSWSGTPS